MLIAREALFYPSGPQGDTYMEQARTYSSKFRARGTPSARISATPAARIRDSPVSLYERQPRQTVCEPAESARMISIYATSNVAYMVQLPGIRLQLYDA